MANYHATPSSFTPISASPSLQAVTFALPAAPTGGFASGSITRVVTDNNAAWAENFSTASGSDAYNGSSTHQCAFPTNVADGLTKTQTVSLTTQQLADLTAAAGTTISCTVNHTTRTTPGNAYSDLYLTLTPGTGPTILSGAADLVSVAAAVGTETVLEPGSAALSGVANVTARGVSIVALPPGTYWGRGYQGAPTTPASDLSETAGSELFVASATGSASCTAFVDFGAAVTVGSLLWTDGTAHNYGALWEHSADQLTWTAITMPAPPTPSGTFAWGTRSTTLGAPVTARYWRLSVADAPGSSTIGTAGIRQITLRNSGGGTLRLTGSYCGSDATFSVSGTWKRYGGVCPHRNAWLTLFYKTCKSPRLVGNAHQIAGSYCSDGDIQRVETQTDCNGRYSFSLTGSIVSANLVVGRYIANPNFDCSAAFSATDNDYNAHISAQWILDPVTASQYGTADVTGTHWVYPDGYYYALGGDSTTVAGYRQDLYGGFDTTDATGMVNPSGLGTPCGNAQTGEVHPCQNMPKIFQFWQPHVSGPLSNYPNRTPLSGTFVFDMESGPASPSSGMTTWIVKNGLWYQVTNAVYQVVDSCGTTETTVYDVPSGFSTYSQVDWPNLTSITLTSAVPPCSPLGAAQPNPVGPNSPMWIYGTDFTPLIAHRSVTLSFDPVVVIEDCSASPTSIRADVFQPTRTLGVAWVNASGALITAVHRSPLAHIGDAAAGWESNQVIEASGASGDGYQFLPTGRAYLDYSLSSSGVYRTNDRQGAGPASAWSATAAQGVVGAGAAGISPLEAYRFVLNAGVWYYSHCRDNRGTAWSGGVAASAAIASGSGCGAAWIGTGYGLLYNRSSDGHAVFRSTQNPDNWSGASDIDLGSTLTVAGLVRMPTGTLVGLLYSGSTQRCRACRSRDRGATWETLAESEIIPALSSPPALVHLDFAAICVWQTGDQPLFAVSVDEGNTWT